MPLKLDNGRGIFHRSLLAIVLVPVLMVLAAVLVANALVGAPVGSAVEDATATLDGHPLTGVGSVVGVLVWWSTASVCLFAYATLRRRPREQGRASFLLWSGLLTAWLALDDQFLLHEDLGARYLDLGQRYFLIAYVAIMSAFLLRYRRHVLNSGWPFLAVSLVLMAASVLTDYLHEKLLYPQTGGLGVPAVIFFEDALKLVGIACWAVFFIGASLDAVAGHPRRAGEARSDYAGPPGERSLEPD